MIFFFGVVGEMVKSEILKSARVDLPIGVLTAPGIGSMDPFGRSRE